MKEYRNAIRSKKMIRTAFAELLSEKHDIDKVTVKEVVERADISKSTFYCHYEDIYAVVEEFGNEIVDLVKDTINDYSKAHKEEIAPYLKKINTILKENESLYRMLMSSDLYFSFINKVKQIVIDNISNDKRFDVLSKNKNHREIQIDIIANGIIYTYVDYFKGNLNVSLDELLLIVEDYIISYAKGEGDNYIKLYIANV